MELREQSSGQLSKQMRQDCKGNDEMGVEPGGLLWAIDQAKKRGYSCPIPPGIVELIPPESNQWVNTLLNSLQPNPRLGWRNE